MDWQSFRTPADTYTRSENHFGADSNAITDFNPIADSSAIADSDLDTRHTLSGTDRGH